MLQTMSPDFVAAGEVCVNILDCFMSRTVLDDIWCLTFFCNAELFKKKKNIKLFQAVLNMQIAKLGNKIVLQNSTGPSLFDVVVSLMMQQMLFL